jgi:hypothetical protein
VICTVLVPIVYVALPPFGPGTVHVLEAGLVPNESGLGGTGITLVRVSVTLFALMLIWFPFGSVAVHGSGPFPWYRLSQNMSIQRIDHWSDRVPVGMPIPVMGLFWNERTVPTPVVTMASPFDVKELALNRTVAIADPALNA